MHDLNARVRHQHVDLAPMVNHLLEACVNGGLVGEDHLNANGRAGAFGREFRSGGLGGIQAQIGDDDFCTVGDVALGNGFADATGGSGDDADFAIQAHGKGQVQAPVVKGLAVWGKVIIHHAAQTKGEVGEDMGGRQHLAHRQLLQRGHGVIWQLQTSRAFPCAFHGDVLQRILHQFADARVQSTWGMILSRKVGVFRLSSTFVVSIARCL